MNYESGREGGLRQNSFLTTELSEVLLNYTDYDVSASNKPSQLYELCVIASKCDSSEDPVWDTIRNWFKSHDKEKQDVAISHRREISSMNPLHAACRHPDPPLDIIEAFYNAPLISQSSRITMHGFLLTMYAILEHLNLSFNLY